MELMYFCNNLWTAFCCLMCQWWTISLKVKAVTEKIQGRMPGSNCDCAVFKERTLWPDNQASERSQVSLALCWDRVFPECPVVPCSDLAKGPQPSNFRTLK